MSKFLVNIFMNSYNHEEFIAEAIEGAISQQISFPYQLIIGEDFSIDNTRNICEEYQDKNRIMYRSGSLKLNSCLVKILHNPNKKEELKNMSKEDE